MRNRWLATVLAAATAAVALAACGSSTTSAPTSTGNTSAPAANSGSTSASGSAAGLKTLSTSKGTILTTASGMAIYWFAIDTSGKSNCSGTCLTYWPPVTGTPSLASGVTLPGKLGTITGTNGQRQATYDGHPLYTYVSDTTPGQISGNNLNASGGLWYVMTPSAAKLGSTTSGSGSTSSGGSGGGGYGY